MFRTPSELRKNQFVDLPLMQVRCSACNVFPSRDYFARAIYLPGTVFPDKSEEEKKAHEERQKQGVREASVRHVGNFFLVEPWEDLTDNQLIKYRTLFKVDPRVECLVCYAKRLLLEALAPQSSLVPIFTDGGDRVFEVFRTWPGLAKEVESIHSTKVFTDKPAENEMKEWARSLIRIVAVAHREAWLYERYRQQQPSGCDLGPMRSVMSSKEQEKARHLLGEAHEESWRLLEGRGIAILHGREIVKRPKGRPSRPALKAVLKLLVQVKIRERKARGAPISKLSALLKVLPILVSVCYDLRDEFLDNPAALRMRLRQYL